ncbi:MAG: hypothetical protein KDC38_11235 [Planctomycetes bacterium]|nr:hypothetical protein [Planctomycetota bacterium]
MLFGQCGLPLARACALASVALLLPSCASEQPKEEPARFETTRSYQNIVLVRAGDKRTDKHVGYLVEMIMTKPGVQDVAYEVQDIGARGRGYYFADGSTYRYLPDGGDERVGVFEANRAIGVLLGYEGVFNLQDHHR